MTTSIDTNIIVALWGEDEGINQRAQAALDQALNRGSLVISGLVFAELLAAPGRGQDFLSKFCSEARIGVEWELSETICRLAGEAFQRYAKKRKRDGGREPRRILADFVIGAHAQVNGYELLTLDERHFRYSFPRLDVVSI
jgi:predicted nucleic acid-binding protein